MTEASSAKIDVVRNDLEDRYEIHVGEHLAGFTQYRDRRDHRNFFHTEIGDEWGGRGLGGILARQAIEETIADGKKIIPTCPFIAAWLKKHPEYEASVLWPEQHAAEPATPAEPSA